MTSTGPAQSVKVLVIGALNGNFKQAFAKASSINSKHGPFDMLLCTGDFFGPPSTESEAAIKSLLAGEIKVPISTYIVTGGHPIPAEVQSTIDKNHGEICENLVYLGASGSFMTLQGVKIVYLSGHSQQSSANSSKTLTYSPENIQSLLPPSPNPDSVIPPKPVPVADILLTCEWPQHITKLSAVADLKLSSPKGTPDRLALIKGAQPVADLASAVQPRYHFASGPGLFFEREPYRNRGGGAKHATRFLGLGDFGAANKERWFYAFNLVPGSKLEPAALNQLPEVVTSSPFFADFNDRKRPTSEGEADTGNFFWSDNQGEKKKRKGRVPPTYICNICKTGGHWVQECPKKIDRRKGPHIEKSRNCWFCLSNPELEKHLLLHIGENAYVAVAKGSIVPWGGHLLIIPMGHYNSLRALMEPKPEEEATANETLTEIQKMKDKIKKAYAERDEGALMFEVYSGSQSHEAMNGVQHMHIHVVPIPLTSASEIPLAFERAAESDHLEMTVNGQLPQDPEAPYIRVEHLDGSVQVYTQKPVFENGQPVFFNVQIGRRVAAELLGTPERAAWKRCVVPMQQEVELTEGVKAILKF
ncbi:hypothetical protein HDV05_005964 [Chytridiales sp. JEL 0842]|nr:hypothetical protein HDV05_005964 [Chytridiales sp. JEL 0842]